VSARTACCVSAALGLGLLVAALIAVSPVLAQEPVPDGFFISLDQDGAQPWANGEWKTLSGGDQDLSIAFYMNFPGDYNSGCIEMDFSYTHDGETTSEFFRGPVGVYLSVNENSYNVTGQEITLNGTYSTSIPIALDSTGTVQQWLLRALYPDQSDYYHLVGASTGSAVVCVTDSDDDRPASFVLYNDDETYYVADTQEINMRWGDLSSPGQTTAYTSTTEPWTLPGPLTPITFTIDPAQPLPWGGGSVIDVDIMWWVARVALTIYHLLPLNVWIVFGLIILIPIIGMLLYRLMIEPPDI